MTKSDSVALETVNKILNAVNEFGDKLADPSVLSLVLCGEIAQMARDEMMDTEAIRAHLEYIIKSAPSSLPLGEEEHSRLLDVCFAAAIEFRTAINNPP